MSERSLVGRRCYIGARRRPLGRYSLLVFSIFGVIGIALGGNPPKSIASLHRGGWQRFSEQSSRPDDEPLTSGRCGCHSTLSRTKGTRYAWQASVDRDTGIARSLEISNVPVDSRLAKSLNNGCREFDFKVAADDMFSGYPLWLCRFPVTFGLLQAYADKQRGYHIRVRPFGIQIISFGVPRRHDVTFRNENGEKCTDCTVVLPITGGIVSLAGPRGDRGLLKFTLRRTWSRKPMGDLASKHAVERTDCRIVTAISDYRPMLCGSGTPVNPLRAGFYLGTQSILHGYIMWRFHRHCRGYELVNRSVP